MPQLHVMPIDRLSRLIGLPTAPALIDVRSDAAFAADPRLIPGAVRRPAADLAAGAPAFIGQPAVVIGLPDDATATAIAAQLRAAGIPADVLAGGHPAWAAAGLPLVPQSALPARDGDGRSLWVTRARPKVDRIACPWLIRRFVDPHANILFAATSDVLPIAATLGAAPFDIEADGVSFTHRGDLCTFDVMIEAFGLATLPALARLATIVRGADTGQLHLAPECPGLLAASLGLSRLFADDQQQLEAGLTLYDALYRWCRDATDEVHDWRSHRPATTGAQA